MPEPHMILVPCAVLIALAGCSSGSGPQATATQTVIVSERTVTETAAPSSTSSRPTTPRSTSASRSTTTTAVPAANLPTGAGAYADELVQAWGIGDRAGADTYATSDTVATLFASSSRGGGDWVRGASLVQDARTQVKYERTSTDEVIYLVVDTATAARGDEDAVVGLSFDWEGADYSAEDYSENYLAAGLPTGVGEYSDGFVRAWGAGRTTDADTYAWSSVMDTVGAYDGPGGGDWARTGTGPGEVTSATYKNSSGWTLTLYLDPSALAVGAQDAITYAEFTH